MILARHAEAIFWAGRQLERLEHTTRLLDVADRDSMHFPARPDQPEWRAVIDTMSLSVAFAERNEHATGTTTERFLFADLDNPGSVAASVVQLRENIRTVRDRVPVELWEETNRLHLELTDPNLLAAEPFERYSVVRRRCHALSGIVAEAMPRDEAFTFFVVGRMIERALVTTRTVRCLVLVPSLALDESAILRTVSCLQAFRRRPGRGHERTTLGAFLLQSEDVPRSVLASLRRAEDRLQRLRNEAPGLGPALMVGGRVRAQLEFGDIDNQLRFDHDHTLRLLEAEITSFGQAIADYAFDPIQAPSMQAQFVRPGQQQQDGQAGGAS